MQNVVRRLTGIFSGSRVIKCWRVSGDAGSAGKRGGQGGGGDGGVHVVKLVHDLTSGRKEIFIDGKQHLVEEGRLLEQGFFEMLVVVANRQVELRIRPTSAMNGGFSYELQVDGDMLPDALDLVSPTHSLQRVNAAIVDHRAVVGEKGRRGSSSFVLYRIKVTVTYVSEDGIEEEEPVVLQMPRRIGSGEGSAAEERKAEGGERGEADKVAVDCFERRQHSVEKRYSEFVVLDKNIRAFLRDRRSHLIDSLPKLPKKAFKLWTNHAAGGFVSERRLQLQNYLVSLLQFDKVSDCPVLEEFLGVKPLQATLLASLKSPRRATYVARGSSGASSSTRAERSSLHFVSPSSSSSSISPPSSSSTTPAFFPSSAPPAASASLQADGAAGGVQVGAAVDAADNSIRPSQ